MGLSDQRWAFAKINELARLVRECIREIDATDGIAPHDPFNGWGQWKARALEAVKGLPEKD